MVKPITEPSGRFGLAANIHLDDSLTFWMELQKQQTRPQCVVAVSNENQSPVLLSSEMFTSEDSSEVALTFSWGCGSVAPEPCPQDSAPGGKPSSASSRVGLS